MTLGRRALLLIFPVVFAGYAIAASAVYVTQRDSLLRLEQARLRQQVDHLGVLFESDKTVNRSFIHAITGGGALRSFLQEEDDSYRSYALGVRLQQNIDSLTADKTAFLSFSLLKSDLRVAHYFENSADPFAEMNAAQKAFAARLSASSETHAWGFVDADGPKPLIVNAEFIDPLTMNRPFANRASDAALIMAAIRPERFLRLKAALEVEYRARLVFGDRPFHETGTGVLSASAELGPDDFIRLTPAPSYFADMLSGLKVWLALGTIVISLLSISLLIALVRRFITRPISKLDRQLIEVFAGERSEIAITEEAGEIGSLSINMKSLHDGFVRSLNSIQTASWTDTLTGVSNRAHFNTLAAEALDAADRKGARLNLLFIDIDNFKFVNDRFGHDVGDELLKNLAARFAEVVTDVERRGFAAKAILARLSGDEFAVLVESSDATAEEIADGILAIFSVRYDGRFPVGVSIGVASFPGTAADIGELLANADLAMYEAKAAGKNRRTRFSREMREKHLRERAIQEELRRMKPDEEFRLVYMPIVDRAGGVVSCEALLRWTSPRLGAVPPDEFVPIAERNGLFTGLDRWVIDRALSDHAQLAAWFGGDVVVSINVSSAELHTTSLCSYLSERMAARGVAPGHVEIELTETFAVGLHSEISRNVRAFRDVGVRIAIDDFGAGYTSIQQVTDYSADTIKLDRAFTEQLARSPATLRALVALCQSQGMAIVAEGVDSREKIGVLLEAGCDRLQGFEICKPLPLEDLGVWQMERTVAAARIGAAGAVRPRQTAPRNIR